MQKVFNAISLLTFIAVGAQVVGVVYLVNNQDSIKEAVIKEAVTAVMAASACLGWAATCLSMRRSLQSCLKQHLLLRSEHRPFGCSCPEHE